MWVHHPSQGYVQGNFSNLLNPPNDTQFNTRAPVSGHPVGVQLIASRYREDICLDAAAAIEARVGVLAHRLWAREGA